jgi:hypothetical protein
LSSQPEREIFSRKTTMMVTTVRTFFEGFAIAKNAVEARRWTCSREEQCPPSWPLQNLSLVLPPRHHCQSGLSLFQGRGGGRS